MKAVAELSSSLGVIHCEDARYVVSQYNGPPVLILFDERILLSGKDFEIVGEVEIVVQKNR